MAEEKATSSTIQPKVLPPLQTREELAEFLGLPLKTLTFILYNADKPRSSYYSVRTHKKSSGGVRLIHAVGEPLKKLQRTTLKRLTAYVGPSKYAHGFVPEHSIVTNARHHVRKKLVVKFDIKDFFPSITFQRIRGMLCGFPFSFGTEVATTIAQMACLEGPAYGLPQGGALSPFLSNMVCRRLDTLLAAIARQHRCTFTRYADDVTLSTNDIHRLQISTLIKDVHAAFVAEGFIPNVLKTRVMRRWERQVVTGVIVNDGLNVNRQYINNLRATLFNCRQQSIESQICRTREPRDPRTSRHTISRGPDGKWRIGTREVLEEEAVRAFLRHLLGKILFIGQVVGKPVDGTPGAMLGRHRVYQSLLCDFYHLVKKRPKLGRFREIVRNLMTIWPELEKDLEADDKRFAIRRKTLEEYRRSPEFAANRAELDGATTIQSLDTFRLRMAKTDPRFVLQLKADITAAHAELIEILSYPRVSPVAFHNVVHSFRQSSDGRLGELTHTHQCDDDSPLTGARALGIIESEYDSRYYYLPEGFRRKVCDPFLDALAAVAIDLQPDEVLSPPDHPSLADACSKFKESTRLGGDGPGITSIKRLILAIAEDPNRVEPSGKKLELHVASFPTIYTSVPHVRRGLSAIIESMHKHAEGGLVRINSRVIEHDSQLELTIESECLQPLGEMPGRQFAHGKLRRAISSLNGICAYFVSAQFSDGQSYEVNMLADSAPQPLQKSVNSFRHRLVFSLPSE